MRTFCVVVTALAAAGCVSTYAGTARPADAAGLEEPGWRAVADVPVILQESARDCGAAALAMILRHYGDGFSPRDAATPERGLRADRLRDLARARGHAAFCIRATRRDLESELSEGRPVIVGLVKPHLTGALPHYEIVIGIDGEGKRVATIDPARGLTVNSWGGFEGEWRPAGNLAIVISPKETAPGGASR